MSISYLADDSLLFLRLPLDLCRWKKLLPAKLCLQCCSKYVTHFCILPHTRCQVISSSFAASSNVPRLVHISLLQFIINTSLDSSFFSWSGLSLCFVSWELLYLCRVWIRFCALEFAIAFLLRHKSKLTPQSHLCDDPSIVPLKASDMCFSLQALCDTQKPLCWICYKNRNARAQTNTTQSLLLALSRNAII